MVDDPSLDRILEYYCYHPWYQLKVHRKYEDKYINTYFQRTNDSEERSEIWKFYYLIANFINSKTNIVESYLSIAEILLVAIYFRSNKLKLKLYIPQNSVNLASVNIIWKEWKKGFTEMLNFDNNCMLDSSDELKQIR